MLSFTEGGVRKLAFFEKKNVNDGKKKYFD
jgi:hypothetical protein